MSEVLQQVRDAATSYRSQLSRNEAATRAALVDPVLRALGWDVANPDTVEVERTERKGNGVIRADYALFSNNVVTFVVEAKTLGDDLLPHRNQVVDYAFAFRIGSVFLTNGLVWEHYTQFDPTNLTPTRILNLETDDLGEVAAYLVQVLDTALVSTNTQVIDQLALKVEQLEAELQSLRTLKDRVAAIEQAMQQGPVTQPALAPVVVSSVASNWVSLHSLAGTDIRGKQPSELRLPNGDIIPVKSWTQVLVEACKYTVAHNPVIPVPFPDKAGRRVNLIGNVRPPSNVTSSAIQLGDNTVYVYTNYDANTCVANTLHVLSKAPNQLSSVAPALVLRK